MNETREKMFYGNDDVDDGDDTDSDDYDEETLVPIPTHITKSFTNKLLIKFVGYKNKLVFVCCFCCRLLGLVGMEWNLVGN